MTRVTWSPTTANIAIAFMSEKTETMVGEIAGRIEGQDMGRPSSYTEEIAGEICAKLAEGLSLREICRQDDFPDKSTVMRWLAQHKGFQDQYARAKEIGVEALAEDILDIADDGTNDWMERLGSDGQPAGWVFNGEAARRSQIRIDARRWLLSKLAPKKYGDKLAIGGADDLPPIKRMTDDELDAAIKTKMEQMNGSK